MIRQAEQSWRQDDAPIQLFGTIERKTGPASMAGRIRAGKGPDPV
jgi:hypothetical protein